MPLESPCDGADAAFWRASRSERLLRPRFNGTRFSHWRESSRQLVQGEPKVLISHRTFLLWQYSHELLGLGLRGGFASLAAGRLPCIAEAFYHDIRSCIARPLDYSKQFC